MTKPPPLPLHANDKIKIGMHEYTGAVRVDGGYQLVSVAEKSTHIDVSDETLIAHLERGEIEIFRQFYKRIGREGSQLDNLSVAALPTAQRLEACRRHAWVMFFLDGEKAKLFSRSDSGLKTAIAAIQADPEYRQLLLSIGSKVLSTRKRDEITTKDLKKILHNSPRTLLRWVTMYEEGGHRIAALCPRTHHRGNRLPKIHPEVLQIVRRAVQDYLQRTQPTIKSIHESAVDTVVEVNKQRAERGEAPHPLPSEKLVSRIIRGMDAYRVAVAREGREAADKRFSPVGAGLMVERIGERVEGDEWRIHAFALLVRHDLWKHMTKEQRDAARNARFSLTVFIDVATKVIVGLHLYHAAETNSAIKALSLIGRDKTSISQHYNCSTNWSFACGVDLIVTDNGSQFLSHEFHAAANSIAEMQYAIAAKADQRGNIERFFERIHVDLIGALPGKTFSGAKDRGDYDSKSFASLTVDELIYIIVRYIVDDYHNSPHEGLDGETPVQRWVKSASRYGIKPPPTPAERRLAWGMPLKRRLGRTGVTFLGIDYNSSELAEHLRRYDRCDVEIRVDPDDLDEISVKLDAGWVSVPQRIPGLAEGLNLDQWRQVLAEINRRIAKNKEIHHDVVARARSDIRDVIIASRHRAELLETRPSEEQISRWESELCIGLRVVGDPVLSSSEPTGLLGIAFPTGGLVDQISPSGTGLRDEPPGSADGSRADRTEAVRSSVPERSHVLGAPNATPDEMPLAEPYPAPAAGFEDDDDDEIEFYE